MTEAPAQQLALPPESHRNHYLFSDHYLAHVVPALPAWRSADVGPLAAEHERRTAETVRLETDLNARVYTLFDLTVEEVRLVETATKYRYGEV